MLDNTGLNKILPQINVNSKKDLKFFVLRNKVLGYKMDSGFMDYCDHGLEIKLKTGRLTEIR